jgi:anaerobic selenocysteine-containing dehydrogenase
MGDQGQEAGGTVIHVDPRFTRTSARSDLYAPLRSGSDIGFLGGMIKYILDNDLTQKEYVLHYTNASFIVSKDFSFQRRPVLRLRRGDAQVRQVVLGFRDGRERRAQERDPSLKA